MDINKETFDLTVAVLNLAADSIERKNRKILSQRRELRRLNKIVRAQSDGSNLRSLEDTIKRQNAEIGALRDQLAMMIVK